MKARGEYPCRPCESGKHRRCWGSAFWVIPGKQIMCTCACKTATAKRAAYARHERSETTVDRAGRAG